MSDSYIPDNEPRYILLSLEELAAKKLPHAPTFRKAADEITRLRAQLAAVTKERDRMMAAFEKAANDMRPMLRSMISRNEAEEIVRRAARAAIEGVTEKEGAGNE